MKQPEVEDRGQQNDLNVNWTFSKKALASRPLEDNISPRFLPAHFHLKSLKSVADTSFKNIDNIFSVPAVNKRQGTHIQARCRK